MRVRHVKVVLAALLAISGSQGLQAQNSNSQYKVDFKTRFGMYTGDMQTTHFDNKIIGFGLQVKRELFGPGRAISAEVAWEHVPGRHYDATDYVTNHQNATVDYTKGILALHPWWSFDDRKEAARGFSLLVSYYSKMPTGFSSDILNYVMENTEWFIGLRIDRYRVFSEYKWTLRDMSNMDEIIWGVTPPTTPIPPIYGEILPSTSPARFEHNGGHNAGHQEGANLTPGLFAGIKHKLNETIAFEFGARYFGMKHWEFTPGAYFNEGGFRMKTGSTFGYGLEFALVCKL
jgi:hypothetical protein